MIGIDTNILLYSIDNSNEEKHAKALEIIEDIFRNPENYCISLQVLSEFAYVINKKYRKAKSLAKELIIYLLNSGVKIVNYSEKELLLAMQHKKVFDALIAYTYYLSGCNTLLTENKKDMPKIKELKIVNPFHTHS